MTAETGLDTQTIIHTRLRSQLQLYKEMKDIEPRNLAIATIEYQSLGKQHLLAYPSASPVRPFEKSIASAACQIDLGFFSTAQKHSKRRCRESDGVYEVPAITSEVPKC